MRFSLHTVYYTLVSLNTSFVFTYFEDGGGALQKKKWRWWKFLKVPKIKSVTTFCMCHRQLSKGRFGVTNAAFWMLFRANVAAFCEESYRKDFRTFTYFFIAASLKFLLELLFFNTVKLFNISNAFRKNYFFIIVISQQFIHFIISLRYHMCGGWYTISFCFLY
jgi:hypothetical protein